MQAIRDALARERKAGKACERKRPEKAMLEWNAASAVFADTSLEVGEAKEAHEEAVKVHRACRQARRHLCGALSINAAHALVPEERAAESWEAHVAVIGRSREIRLGESLLPDTMDTDDEDTDLPGPGVTPSKPPPSRRARHAWHPDAGCPAGPPRAHGHGPARLARDGRPPCHSSRADAQPCGAACLS